MEETTPVVDFEQTNQPQEETIEVNNLQAEAEIAENAPVEVSQDDLQEVEEKPHEEETERGEDEAEQPVLEEEETKPEPEPQFTTPNKRQQSISHEQREVHEDHEDEDEVEAVEDQSPTYKDFFEKEKSPSQSISKKIERPSTTNESPSSNRWDQLYERAKLSQEKKKKIKEEQEANKKEDPECTFKPRLLTSTYDALASGDGEPVHKRTTTWRANKDKKLVESREQNRDKDLSGCTFKPNLDKSQGSTYTTQNLSQYGSKGVDLHLKRQVVAKIAKEEKETILDNPLQKLPAHVYKKEGNITIPKGPEFNKGKPIEINALKKPFEFPTPRNSANDKSSPKKNLNSPQKESQTLVDPVQVNNVKFGQAIQMLHNELHRIKINSV